MVLASVTYPMALVTSNTAIISIANVRPLGASVVVVSICAGSSKKCKESGMDRTCMIRQFIDRFDH